MHRNQIRKLNCAKFQAYLNKLTNDTQVIVSKYRNNNTLVLIYCKKCHTSWWEMRCVVNRYGHSECPYCKLMAKFQMCKQKIYKLGQGDYKCYNIRKIRIRGEVNVQILIKHLKCGHSWWCNPYYFIQERGRCPICNRKSNARGRKGSNAMTNIDWINRVRKLGHGHYVSITPYTGSKHYVYMYHVDCGNIYRVKCSAFSSGDRCPYCDKRLRNEVVLGHVLGKYNIEYRHSFEIIVVKNGIKHYLSLDFYLPKIHAAIEYDGIEHFKPIAYFGGIHTYMIENLHARWKNKWCKQHHIKLFRIKDTKNKATDKWRHHLIKRDFLNKLHVKA